MKPCLKSVRVVESVPPEKPRIGKTLLTGKPYICAATHVSSHDFRNRQIARGLKVRTP